MKVSLGKEISFVGIYDPDDPVRSKVYNILNKVLRSFPKGSVKCLGKYKNGMSMDFCEICARIGILKEVVVPYEDNDHSWPDPIKTKFKEIIKKSESIRLVSRGGFNPKKIKDMDDYISKNSDYTINIEISNLTPIVTLIKNEH